MYMCNLHFPFTSALLTIIDQGVDDAHGLVLLLAAPHVEVKGISCVVGNAHTKQVFTNVSRVLKLFHRTDIPVYIGAAEPLMGFTVPPSDYHGPDGKQRIRHAHCSFGTK